MLLVNDTIEKYVNRLAKSLEDLWNDSTLPAAIKLVKDILSTDQCSNVCHHFSNLKASSF